MSSDVFSCTAHVESIRHGAREIAVLTPVAPQGRSKRPVTEFYKPTEFRYE
jgi:hypothetical protein